MIWYWVFVLLTTVLFAVCVYLAYRFRRDKLDDFIDWVKPNMFETIWCAVSRKTKSGVILGLNETVDVKSAIKAVTINSAFQYFEEDIKGSIKKGKLANLIIVDKNPLSIKFEDIKNIKVLETIKEGRTLYKS